MWRSCDNEHTEIRTQIHVQMHYIHTNLHLYRKRARERQE